MGEIIDRWANMVNVEILEGIGMTNKPTTTEIDFSKLRIEISPEELTQWNETITQSLSNYNKDNNGPHDTVAVVVGRFQPPHKGHLFEILAGLRKIENVDDGKLVVIVGSPKEKDLPYGSEEDRGNPFSFQDRVKMLMYAANQLEIPNIEHRLKFVHVRDVGNDKLWGEKVSETVRNAGFGAIDVVVANDGFSPRKVQGIFANMKKRIFALPFLDRESNRSTLIRQKSGLFAPGGRHIIVWNR